MLERGIDFDRIVKSRINKYYVINLFNQKQYFKIKNPLRCALHNATTNNLHKIYSHNVYSFKDFITTQDKIPDSFQKDHNSSGNKMLYEEDIWFEDEFGVNTVESHCDNLCFLSDDDYLPPKSSAS
tara:strand:+ start:1837 stop:2214 length:378 start_codon:yes stop_codon:yes gene_type:complete